MADEKEGRWVWAGEEEGGRELGTGRARGEAEAVSTKGDPCLQLDCSLIDVRRNTRIEQGR